DGTELTVHTPNTGSMLGLTEPGSRIWLRDANSPTRKYRYSWEIASSKEQMPVCVNTHLANQLVIEGIKKGVITELQGYRELETEVQYGQERSRIDVFLTNGEGQNGNKQDCYVEVKNVTAMLDTEGTQGIAIFPDAVTQRGSKHLRELMNMVERGQRAVIVFCVSRADATQFQPADLIDPVYGQLLRKAVTQGVEALAYSVNISVTEICLKKSLPVMLPDL
ncbi:MAG: DNA/RNA nuclease SfsA, partial [Gammaproteobacteria bacterium]|nr:DNA/RNA nuclease SfsA [Gammaproteobacteria bacterium]